MRHAFFGDIHGNFDAFQAVLADIEDQEIDGTYCLGDIVGYGAEPRECLISVRDLACPAVVGNHDYAAARDTSLDDFNDYARAAILWTRERLTEEDKRWLADLPFVVCRDGFSVAHSSLFHPETFPYILSLTDALECFEQMATPLCFVGHSHVPLVFFDAPAGGMPAYELDLKEPVVVRGRMIVNPGSVGQPRDGDPRAAYCIYDTATQRITFRRVRYNVLAASRKIQDAGLPALLGWRLEIGR